MKKVKVKVAELLAVKIDKVGNKRILDLVREVDPKTKTYKHGARFTIPIKKLVKGLEKLGATRQDPDRWYPVSKKEAQGLFGDEAFTGSYFMELKKPDMDFVVYTDKTIELT